MQKLIEILHEVLPDARRIGILLNERNPSYRALSAAAQSQQSQAVIVVPDPVYLNERTVLQKLMQATRLPAAYGLREHVVAGGLLSYAADLAGNYRTAATYVDRILKGAKPAELPVEQPTKYELMINLKTAQALGITIPQSVLLRADELIR